MSPIHNLRTSTLSDGNLVLTGVDGWDTNYATQVIQGGKWYFEALEDGTDVSGPMVGVQDLDSDDKVDAHIGSGTDGWAVYFEPASGVSKYTNNTNVTLSLGTAASGGKAMIAVDADAGKIWFGYDGTWSGDPSAGTGEAYSGLPSDLKIGGGTSGSSPGSPVVRFGFGAATLSSGGNADSNGYGDFEYTVPTGFLALCTANQTALTFDPTDHVQNEVYTGSGATGKSVTQSGNGSFTTQMAWIKSESQGSSGYNGYNVLVADLIAMGEDVYNPLNGQNNLDSDVNSVESFDSGGITLGSLNMINNDGDTFRILMFGGAGAEATDETGTIDSSVRVNTTADFSFGTWTGSGAAATIGHGLSGPPDVILVSNLTNDSKARIYHSHAGNTKALSMEEEPDGWQTSTTYWNDTTPGGTTAGTFNVGSSSDTNGSGDTMFFFALKYVEGFSAGGGGDNPDSTDGPVYCTGGVPQYFQWSSISAQTQVLTNYDADEEYNDGARATTIFNAGDNAGFTHDVDFNSNGVKIRHTSSTADDHMWWAINRMPTVNKSETPAKAR